MHIGSVHCLWAQLHAGIALGPWVLACSPIHWLAGQRAAEQAEHWEPAARHSNERLGSRAKVWCSHQAAGSRPKPISYHNKSRDHRAHREHGVLLPSAQALSALEGEALYGGSPGVPGGSSPGAVLDPGLAERLGLSQEDGSHPSGGAGPAPPLPSFLTAPAPAGTPKAPRRVLGFAVDAF